MKWPIRPLLFAGAVIALCCVRSAPEPLSARAAYRPPVTLRVRVIDRTTQTTREVLLEDYVEATVLSEFAPAAGDEAIVESMLEVQAIISRTYALAHVGRHAREGFDLCSTTHCQLYEPGRLRTSRWTAAAAKAVRNTSGLVLWYDGAPAEALFHADCGGRTSSAADVWGGPNPPYLRELDDDGPASDAHVAWRYEASIESVRQALNADQRTEVGRRAVVPEDLARSVAYRLSGCGGPPRRAQASRLVQLTMGRRAEVESLAAVSTNVRKRVGSTDHRLHLEHGFHDRFVAGRRRELAENSRLDVVLERNIAGDLRRPIERADSNRGRWAIGRSHRKRFGAGAGTTQRHHGTCDEQRRDRPLHPRSIGPGWQ